MSWRKRVLIGFDAVMDATLLDCDSSVNLRAIVVFSLQYAHEAQARRALEVARIEEDCGYRHPSLQLLRQRERAIGGKERARSDDEDDVAPGVGIARHARGDEV